MRQNLRYWPSDNVPGTNQPEDHMLRCRFLSPKQQALPVNDRLEWLNAVTLPRRELSIFIGRKEEVRQVSGQQMILSSSIEFAVKKQTSKV